MAAAGKANFTFVCAYQKAGDTPKGQVRFTHKAGDLDSRATSFDWLVVAGGRAQCQGAGTVNGREGYGFMLTAVDGQYVGESSTDRLRVRIWEKATGALLYDNQPGADVNAPLSDSAAIGAGNLVVHSKTAGPGSK